MADFASKMKPTILFLLAVLTVAATTNDPAQLKLAWNPSPSPAVEYVLTASNHLAFEQINVGTNLSCKLTDLQSGQWVFYVQAVRSNVYSIPSNLLFVDVPQTPSTFRTVVIQQTQDFTNWTDRGFFRLYIP